MKITICMGSSCFSRGNNRNIEVLQDYARKRGIPLGVEVTGHLCEGLCNQGPNLNIGGKTYHGVDPIVITGLLQHHQGPGAP
jgi:NADH:ubiquinone oxidoreductase subunit E